VRERLRPQAKSIFSAQSLTTIHHFSLVKSDQVICPLETMLMNNSLTRLPSLTVLATLALLAAYGAEARAADAAMKAEARPASKARPTISDGQRALAMWEVQKLMSKHEFLHAAIQNEYELEHLWVDASGPYAKSATFGSPAWVMNGLDTIKRAYGRATEDSKAKALEAVSKIDPNIKNIPENLGAGSEWVMHTSTTPVIEVAGDGKTAKGVWFSPGMGLMPSIDGTSVKVRGTFFWEKYGGDFVKEHGQWRIWHLQMAYDYTPGLDEHMTENLGRQGEPAAASDGAKGAGREAGERMGGALPEGFTKPKFSYPAYNYDRVPTIYPKLPEPYYTFSETFSY
jgi:hypothetical protein